MNFTRAELLEISDVFHELEAQGVDLSEEQEAVWEKITEAAEALK